MEKNQFDQAQDGELALLVVSGSHAWGLAHEASDIDLRGVYVAPSRDFFRLGSMREHVEMQNPDITVFELRKFCRLAAAGNPNILEMLFMPEKNIVVASAVWAQVKEAKEVFRSRAWADAYIGYARTQTADAKRLAAGEAVGGRWKERTRRKHLGHVLRVLDEGEQLLRSGELSVKVQNKQGIQDQARRPIEEIVALLQERVEVLSAVPCAFPLEPNWAGIDNLLVKVREEVQEREIKLGPATWNLAEVDYASAGWPSPVGSGEVGVDL